MNWSVGVKANDHIDNRWLALCSFSDVASSFSFYFSLWFLFRTHVFNCRLSCAHFFSVSYMFGSILLFIYLYFFIEPCLQFTGTHRTFPIRYWRSLDLIHAAEHTTISTERRKKRERKGKRRGRRRKGSNRKCLYWYWLTF